MAVYPVPAVGQRLTADFVASMLYNTALKNSDTDRASTTAVASDPDLITGTLDTSATYEIEMNVGFSGTIAAGMKAQWIVPTGATGFRHCQGPLATATGSTGGADFAQNSYVPFTTAVTYQNPRNSLAVPPGATFREVAILVMSTTAGTVALQWAQNVSTATATRVYSGSYVRYRRIA